MDKRINAQDNDLQERITEHAERLGIIKECFSLFQYCFENDAFSTSKTEVYDFAVVLKEYITNTKKEFSNIEDKIHSGQSF